MVHPCVSYWFVTQDAIHTRNVTKQLFTNYSDQIEVRRIKETMSEDYCNALYSVLKDFNNAYVFNKLGLCDDHTVVKQDLSLGRLYLLHKSLQSVVHQAAFWFQKQIFIIEDRCCVDDSDNQDNQMHMAVKHDESAIILNT